MAITAENILMSLFDLARSTIDELYEHKSENAGNYGDQLAEIHQQYDEMTGSNVCEHSFVDSGCMHEDEEYCRFCGFRQKKN